mmetsp:Transcript_3902/g.8406  ORF Transcript_3902/g.8406 Transcript_3902/m.8406 type:complete len:275 (-) Transcript_3902:274-1098(-)
MYRIESCRVRNRPTDDLETKRLCFFTTQESTLPIGLVDSDQLDVEQKSSIHPGIVEDEIQGPLSRKGARFRADLVVGRIVLCARIAQFAVGDNDLPDASHLHALHGQFQSLDHVSFSQNGSGIILGLVEGSALGTTLGLEGSTEITDRVSAPFKDDPVSDFREISRSKCNIPERESLGGLGEILVLLQIGLRSLISRGRQRRRECTGSGNSRESCRRTKDSPSLVVEAIVTGFRCCLQLHFVGGLLFHRAGCERTHYRGACCNQKEKNAAVIHS